MSRSEQLRMIHQNMQLNKNSKKQDQQIKFVVQGVKSELESVFNVRLVTDSRLLLKDILTKLRAEFKDVQFVNLETQNSCMIPDGGITYLIDKEGKKYPILIGEVKSQGTNDERIKKNMKKQSMGNAIERLAKNVIGFRTFMFNESIFPFVCFGSGCDFEKGSSILDRVHVVAMFGSLNDDHTADERMFNRGSYYFRPKVWTVEEQYDIMYNVAKKSILYYFDRYDKESFM